MNKPGILVVDDDPQVLAAVRRDLRSRYREHYTVLSAGSGQEALATVRELKSRGDSLAMLISDQRMPNMSGVEFLKEVWHRHPSTVRMILTGFADMEAIIESINDGHVYAYIAGLRWDTSGGAGPRWHTDARSNSGFVARHPSGF